MFLCISLIPDLRLRRYLQNGNILAARTFISHFVAQSTSRRPSLQSAHQPSPIPVGKSAADTDQDEIVFTTVSELNFAQLAVRACQRAQGDKNKAMREAWVRLCGTYQSKGGPIAHREVRKVRPLALAYLFQCPRSGAHSVLWSDVSTPLIPYPSSAGFVRIAQPQQCYKRSPRCPSSPLDWGS